MFFAGLDADRVAGGNRSNRLAPFLDETAPFLDEQQLRCTVTVPVGPSARLELDEIDDDRLAAVLEEVCA